MEDKRFEVNNLGDGCWLFYGPASSGKNELANLIFIKNLILINISSIPEFISTLQKRYYHDNRLRKLIKKNFIFIVKDNSIATFIRNYFYDPKFRRFAIMHQDSKYGILFEGEYYEKKEK